MSAPREEPLKTVPDPAADQAWHWLQLMAAGDPQGLAGLYDLFASRVYSLAMRMLRDTRDAEEVVQDVFAQAWRSARRYDRERGTIAAWLLVMARTRALDRLRARRAAGRTGSDDSVDLELLPDTGISQDLAVITEEQAHALRHALEELPADQRLALELAYFEGLSHADVAARLAQPLGTVKTRIRLGLMKLREVFARSPIQDRQP